MPAIVVPFAELATDAGDDAAGRIVLVARPGADLLAAAGGFSVRGIEQQIARLVGVPKDDAAERGLWLRPLRGPTGRGLAKGYRLCVPDDLPPDVIAAALRLDDGMWLELIDADARRWLDARRQKDKTRAISAAAFTREESPTLGCGRSAITHTAPCDRPHSDVDRPHPSVALLDLNGVKGTRGRAREGAPGAPDEEPDPTRGTGTYEEPP
jgi:hypothetical protein